MKRDSRRSEESVPYVIVVGSEKGGTGKSTTAIHLAVAMMKLGFRVGTIDLDARQGTLSAFFRNRAAQAEQSGRHAGTVEAPRHPALDGRRAGGGRSG
jgi:chromosome partitioning protein